MALAIRLEHLIDTGQIADQAKIARTAGLMRARVTQVLNLNDLAPDIQQTVLVLRVHPSCAFRRRAHGNRLGLCFWGLAVEGRSR